MSGKVPYLHSPNTHMPHRDLSPIVLKPPPLIPQTPPRGIYKRILPFFIGVMIIGLLFLFIFSATSAISASNLLYPLIIFLLAVGIYQNSYTGTDTHELNKQRNDYLTYLDIIRARIIAREKQQKNYYHFALPAPHNLINVINSRRLWERIPGHNFYLHVRSGTGPRKLDFPLKLETLEETGFEPLSIQAITELFAYHTMIDDQPASINLAETQVLTIIGSSYEEVMGFLRSIILDAAVFHNPNFLRIGAFSPQLLKPSWSWIKWLPHCDIPSTYVKNDQDRALNPDYYDFMEMIEPIVLSKLKDTEFRSDVTAHQIIILDFFQSPIIPIKAEYSQVTFIQLQSHLLNEEHLVFDKEKPYFMIKDGYIEQWTPEKWKNERIRCNVINIGDSVSIARHLAKWDYNATTRLLTTSLRASDVYMGLLDVPDASRLDMAALWAERPRSEELRVPIGLKEDGAPFYLDLKEEAEGGDGPHGLIIGTSGSGKSQTIAVLLLGLLMTHPADRLNILYADFKGEAEADTFKDFPQVIAVISNLNEKRYIADRFLEIILGEIDRRETLLLSAGRMYNNGVGFVSFTEYDYARLAGANIDQVPTLLIVADEFTIMLQEYPEYAALFELITRKGRSLRMHILFASQTLDIGRMKDIDKNIHYRICLKVQDPATSRHVIGTDQAYYLASSKNSKGVGYFVRPGDRPIKFAAAYVRGHYVIPSTLQPQYPLNITASFFTPTSTNIFDISQQGKGDQEETRRRPLIPLIRAQIAPLMPKAIEMYLPPLEEPMALNLLLSGYTPHDFTWPIGEIDCPRKHSRKPLIYQAHSAQSQLIIHGSQGSGRTTALMTFMLAAAYLYSPTQVQFYCIAYGGANFMWVEDLRHTVAIASGLDEEKIRRIFRELDTILVQRKTIFKNHRCTSIKDMRMLDLDDSISTADIFIMVDGIYLFSKHTTNDLQSRNPWMDNLIALIAEGPSYGIHCIATTSSWLQLPLEVQNSMTMRLELKLSDSLESTIRIPGAITKPQDSIPKNSPGRGITPQGEHFLIAVPRLDGIKSGSELQEPIDVAINIINQHYAQDKSYKLQLLPTIVTANAPLVKDISREEFTLGIGEQNLNTVSHQFRTYPFLAIIGNARSGKTNFIKNITDYLLQLGEHTPVTAFIVDRRGKVLHNTPIPYEFDYVLSISSLPDKITALASYLQEKRSSPHYIIIEDFDSIPDISAYSGKRLWDPLLEVVTESHDNNTRIILTAKASGFSQNMMTNLFLRTLFHHHPSLILLNCDKVKDNINNVPFPHGLCPGRGLYIPDSGSDPEYVQTFLNSS